MKKTALFLCPLVIALIGHMAQIKTADLTIVGFVQPNGGIGKVAHEIMECLADDISINFIPTGPVSSDISPKVEHITSTKYREAGTVALFTNILWSSNSFPYKKVPKKSYIKIAYSMVEYSPIPEQWVEILNEHFDAVVVPDSWQEETYIHSGVTIPVFTVPIVLKLDKFLEKKPKKKANKPFVFGNMGAGKNAINLINSFINAFGNNPNVRLRLHTQLDEKGVKAYVVEQNNKGFNNIEYDQSSLSDKDYVEYLSRFDCYVTLSNGEGFSIPPREALALGIPVIASNNSALETLCKSGFVRPVKSDIPMPISIGFFEGHPAIYSQNTEEDATEALLDVYNNYKKYLRLARSGREWVKQYQPSELKPVYLNLVEPKELILGDRNEITKDYLMTNSEALYLKYNAITNPQDYLKGNSI